ncbi:hypothetical protein JB92DRAFT_2597009, partial [Gautieria morchelliformis]
INGVKAHCLLDSRSAGVLLSPEFTRATGMKTFALEQPIALQLACIGSRSTINYGTNTIIKFGREIYDKYFNVANDEYYDVILGTLFLRRFGITLDFSSPGTIRKGNEIIPMGKRCSHLTVKAMGKRKAAVRTVHTRRKIPIITDLVSGIPLELPPLRESNQEINLIDPNKHMQYQLPKCPEHFREELSAKIERYTTAKWWIPAVAQQSVPMLCVPK